MCDIFQQHPKNCQNDSHRMSVKNLKNVFAQFSTKTVFGVAAVFYDTYSGNSCNFFKNFRKIFTLKINLGIFLRNGGWRVRIIELQFHLSKNTNSKNYNKSFFELISKENVQDISYKRCTEYKISSFDCV